MQYLKLFMCLMSLYKIKYVIMYNNPKSMNILVILRDKKIYKY